jgi:hypothetical protein
MRKILLAVALATSTVACVPIGTGDIASVSDRVMLRGTQALIVAEYAYNSAGTVALQLLNSGVIRGENATRVGQINRIATNALIAGKNAQSDGERAKQAAIVMNVVTELRSITGR